MAGARPLLLLVIASEWAASGVSMAGESTRMGSSSKEDRYSLLKVVVLMSDDVLAGDMLLM